MNVTAALISAAGSVVVGVISFLGIIVTNAKAGRNMQNRLDTAQAVTDTKLDDLTREVRLHNNFALRIPVIEEQIKVINHRITDCRNRM